MIMISPSGGGGHENCLNPAVLPPILQTMTTSTILLRLLALGAALALASCSNTVQGVGQDIGNTGRAIERSVR